MYKICGLQLVPNFGKQTAADNEFYFRLMVEKICAFVAFTEKYLRPFGCRGANFTATVNCANPKTKM